ncbi:MAG: LysM peptidoglycan-binding domain-containing protein [Rickettsiales bacterium]|jgi:hypothetical protein|nr:LysM peptidoglycan-binding domain-containing protein [Rickettsiales bacterium]
MFKREKFRFAGFGKIKKSTEEIVDDAVAKQGRISRIWRGRKPSTPAVSIQREQVRAGGRIPSVAENSRIEKSKRAAAPIKDTNNRGIVCYWFPMVCAVAVVIMILWVILIPRCDVVGMDGATGSNDIPEPTARVVADVADSAKPGFDIVRIERDGQIVVAGRYMPNKSVSVLLNKKIIATEQSNERGEFVYAAGKPLAPGNYVLRLGAVDEDVSSENDVFLYVSPRGGENSISLLLTKGGSKLLQAPKLAQGDLVVQKIDYLENDRIMVQGRALPRLRVTLSLDGRELGFARTSDHKNFGLGAPVGKLEPGREYNLAVKLHDGEGGVVAIVGHRFTMPEMTPGTDTHYTVRHDDALWIIARNFLGRGALYTLIVEKNDISNPNLIFPRQVLQIPIEKARK